MAGLNIKEEGISFEFSGDTAKFDDSINNINRSLSILKKEFTGFKKELKLEPGNLDVLGNEMKNLSQQAALAQHAIEQYDRARRALHDKNGNWILSEEYKTVDSAQAAWTRYTKAMEDAHQVVLQYNERMAEVQKQIDEVNSGLFAQKKALEDSRESFDHSSREMENGLTALGKEFKELQDDIKEQPENVELLTKAMHNLNQQSLTAAKYIGMLKERMAQMTDKDGKVIEGYQQEYDALSKKVIETEHSLETFGRRHDEIRQKIDMLTSEIYKQNKALEESSKRWDLAGNGLKDAGATIESVGRSMRWLSAGAVTAFGGAAKSAIDFESALTGIYKTVDETPTTSYGMIERDIREMAQVLPSTAAEIATVGEMAGQLGITADSLMPFVKTMIDLGNATNLTATEGAKMIARFFNIMGHDSNWVTQNVERFGSAVTALGNNSATTEEEIAYMATNLAAASKTVGLTDQEVLGLATTLSSLGLSAERGGSALSTIMRKIETDVGTTTEKGNKRLQAWGELIGMTGEEFRKAWNEDTVGTIHEIVKGLNQTEDAGKSLYAVLDDVDISNIRQIDTISRLALGYDRFDQYMALANQAWDENTALTTEANRRYETTESQIKILMNRIREIGITLGETLLPIINNLVKKATPYVDAITRIAKYHGEAILTTLGWTAALSPLITGIGRATKGVGSVALAVAKYSLKASESTGATRNIALALANTGKFGLYGAAGLAVVGLTALVGYMIYSNQESVKFKKSINALSDAFNDNVKASQEAYAAREREIDGNEYYIETIQQLQDELKASIGDEQHYEETKQKLYETVAKLNQAIGEEAYTIDEDSGKIMYHGEVVDDLSASYENLAQKMKHQAWLDANYDAYVDSLKKQSEYMQELEDAANRYSEAMRKLNINGVTASEEVLDAIYDYMTGKITDIDEIAEVIRSDTDLMNAIDAVGSDSFSAAREMVRQAQRAQETYNKEIDITADKVLEAMTYQEMYEAVLHGTPEEMQGILESFNQFGDKMDLNTKQLQTLKDAFIRTRNEFNKKGINTKQYDDAIAKIDEMIGRSNAAHKKQNENWTDNANTQIRESTRASGEMEKVFGLAFDGVERRGKTAWNNNLLTANGAFDGIQKAINGLNFDGTEQKASGTVWRIQDMFNRLYIPDKTMYVYVQEHYSSSGAVHAGASGKFSGGFASGGYNVTIAPHITVTGSPNSAMAKALSMQMVGILDQELGKRLRK